MIRTIDPSQRDPFSDQSRSVASVQLADKVLLVSTFLSRKHVHSSTMEFDEFKDALEEETGERSELSKGAYETGRRLAHLPD